MCLLIVLSRVVPDWPLVLAANRDERFDRPAVPVGLLRTDAPRTLGGRDLLAGGTWLAVNEDGVAAGLTNAPIPGGRDGSKRTRGEIPLQLSASTTAAEAAAAFEAWSIAGAFNPCWVLVGDRTGLTSFDLTDPDHARRVELASGVHVLENKPLGAPSTKVEHVRRLLGDVRGTPVNELMAILRRALRDHTPTQPTADDTEEARLASQLSACCVHADGYGTRSSLLLRVPRAADELPEVWASEGPSCEDPLVRIDFGS